MYTIAAWLGIVACWSISWIFASMQAKYPMMPEFSLFYRKLIVGILGFSLAIITKKRLKLTKHELKIVLIVSLFHFVLGYFCTYYSAMLIVSGLIASISGIQPILAELLDSILSKKLPSLKALFGGLIGVIGLVMLFNQTLFSESLDSKVIIGIIIASGLAFCQVIGAEIITHNRRTYHGIPLTTLLGYSGFFASFVFLSTALIKNNMVFVMMPFSIDYVIPLLYLAIFASFVGFALYYYVADKAGALIVSYTSIVIPISSMIISSFFEGFQFNALAVCGLLFLTLSIYIGIKKKR